MIRQPASVIIAVPSGSGKSELVEQISKCIVYCYDRWQPRFDA